MTKKYQLKIAVLSLSALAFVSCKKDDKPAVSGDMMSFTATIDNGGAKTVIDGVNVKWATDDQININGKTFTAEVEGTGETAVFTSETGETVEGTSYKALYPATLYKDVDDYELSDEQTYNSANNLSGINPMYAYSTTTELQFHHLCGLLKLDVKGEGTVKEIKVSKEGVALCGSFTIENNRAVVSNTNDSVVTLNCGDGVEINSTAKTFYIALPQGNYTDLNIEFKGISIWSTTLSVNINAGKIRTKELTGVSVLKPATLPGEFSVSAANKVKFSRGNLWYGDGKFHFEENQWERDPSVGESSNPSHVSHFYWSKTASVAYAENYSDSDASSDDVFFTNAMDTTASSSFQVDGEEAGTWRTLSKAEWGYLLNIDGSSGRTDTNRFAKARLNDVQGLLVFPDGYSETTSGDGIAEVNNTDAEYPSSSIDEAIWTEMESSGAVFLPVSGFRNSMSVSYGDYGLYWSSTPQDGYFAYNMNFQSGNVLTNSVLRQNGCAVRLVRDVE